MIKAQRKQVLNGIAAHLAPLGFAPLLAHRPHTLSRQQGEIRHTIRLVFRDYGGFEWDQNARRFTGRYQESYAILLYIEVRHEAIHRLVRQSLHLKRDIFGEQTLSTHYEGWVERGVGDHGKSWIGFYATGTTFAQALGEALAYLERHSTLEAILDTLLEIKDYTGYYRMAAGISAMAAATLLRRSDLLDMLANKTRLGGYGDPAAILLASALRRQFPYFYA
jgi:hypothetical protein